MLYVMLCSRPSSIEYSEIWYLGYSGSLLTVQKPSIYMWVFTCTTPQLCCHSHYESEEAKAVKSQLLFTHAHDWVKRMSAGTCCSGNRIRSTFSLFFKRLLSISPLLSCGIWRRMTRLIWQLFSLQGTHKQMNVNTQTHSNGYLNNSFFTLIMNVLFLRLLWLFSSEP